MLQKSAFIKHKDFIIFKISGCIKHILELQYNFNPLVFRDIFFIFFMKFGGRVGSTFIIVPVFWIFLSDNFCTLFGSQNRT